MQLQHGLLRKWIHQVRHFSDCVRHFRRITLGAIRFFITGVTPQSAHQSLVALFCETRGLSNDLFHSWVSILHPPKGSLGSFGEHSGAFGNFSRDAIEHAARQIHRDGYHVFSGALCQKRCEALYQFAITEPCHPVTSDGKWLSPIRFDTLSPVQPIYKFREESLIRNASIQQLMADPVFIGIAEAYLGCTPVMSSVMLWWTTSSNPHDAGGQLYHFDMDYIKWLKFFIYLNDVTFENGPHRFIRGTHRRGTQPAELLKLGYARITDENISKYYSCDSFIEFVGKAGTVFAEDTRGFHKGEPVKTGQRLVLEFEFTDSLFGGALRRSKLEAQVESPIWKAIADRPRLFSKFELTRGIH